MDISNNSFNRQTMNDMPDMQEFDECPTQVKTELDYTYWTNSPENVKQETSDVCEAASLEMKEENKLQQYCPEEEEEFSVDHGEGKLANFIKHYEVITSQRILRSSKPRMVQCNQCDEYIDQGDIMGHVSKIHPKRNVTFACGDCEKGFNFESGLILHRAKQHGGELTTREGSSTFTTPSNCVSCPVVFPCELCHKTFKHTSALSVHLQNHYLETLVYECNVCDKPFTDQDEYEAHLKVHDGMVTNQCYICNTVLSRPEVCQEHIRKHHLDAKYRCLTCPKVFIDATSLAMHSVQHNPRDFKCRHCNKKLISRAQRDEHERVHVDDDKPTDCPSCNRTFANKNLLKDHRKLVHMGKEGHACNICGTEFFMLKNLQAHHREHATRKVIQCNLCEETFDLRSSWRLHMKFHLKLSRLFKCLVCPKLFTSYTDLETHVSGHCGDDSLDCYVCGAQLADTGEIMEHVDRHKEEKRIVSVNDYMYPSGKQKSTLDRDKKKGSQVKCPVCGKTFHFVSSLQSHVRIHETDQPLSCHLCKQTFAGIKNIREHMASDHADTNVDREANLGREVERRFQKRHRCDICLERFISYYAAKTHRLLHTGVKAFVCDVCGRSYVLSGSLKSHKLCHLKDKPHVCEVCGKTFKQLYILREHQMSHTGNKPFLCDLCGKSFVNKKKLDLHTFVHTRKTPFNCKVCGRGFRAFVTRQKHRCEGPPIAEGPALEASSSTARDTIADRVYLPRSESIDLSQSDATHMSHSGTTHMSHSDSTHMSHSDYTHMSHSDSTHMPHSDKTPHSLQPLVPISNSGEITYVPILDSNQQRQQLCQHSPYHKEHDLGIQQVGGPLLPRHYSSITSNALPFSHSEDEPRTDPPLSEMNWSSA